MFLRAVGKKTKQNKQTNKKKTEFILTDQGSQKSEPEK